MKKLIPLLAACLVGCAAGPAGSSASKTFQMRLVLDKSAADTEKMSIEHKVENKSVKEALFVQKNVLLDQTAVKAARVVTPPRGNPQIEITFTDAGKKQFADVTRTNINNRIAIIIDGRVYEAPTVRSEISGGITEVTGSFSAQDANQLAAKIESALKKK